MLLSGCAKKPIEPEPTSTPKVQTEIEMILAETDVVQAAAVQTPAPTPTQTATQEPAAPAADTPEPTEEPVKYVAQKGVYTIAIRSTIQRSFRSTTMP